MRSYRKNSHSKYDLKAHLVWIPKYRKRVLTGKVAERARDLLRQICMEHEVHIISGKVVCDHIHMFVSYRPQLPLSKMVQYLKGTSSRILLQEFGHLRKQFWGRLERIISLYLTWKKRGENPVKNLQNLIVA